MAIEADRRQVRLLTQIQGREGRVWLLQLVQAQTHSVQVGTAVAQGLADGLLHQRRRMVTQQVRGMTLDSVIGEKKILLVNLEQFRPLRTDDVRLLGRFIVNAPRQWSRCKGW